MGGGCVRVKAANKHTIRRAKHLATILCVGIAAFVISLGDIACGSSNSTTQSMGGQIKTATNAIEETQVVVPETIPFTPSNENDPTLAVGQTKVKQEGVNGSKDVTYRVTYNNGKETKREKVSEKITVQPIPRITLIGTYVAPPPPPPRPASNCDPNYSGCVPIDSDVDCAGGSGNGPSYVAGPVNVTGSDIYGLDRDGDGVGCE